VRPHVPKRLQTDPLSDEDLDPAKLSVGDSTQPLSLDEVEIAAQSMAVKAQSILKGEKQPAPEFGAENRTMNLSMDEIAKLVVPPKPPVGKLPPPPPRPPQITATTSSGPRAKRVSAPPPLPGMTAARKPQAPVRRPPLPTLPNRSFDTPWEELAVAYESLPATDAPTRLRWLYRASEVWETGGKDIARAFDALARAFAQARRLPDQDTEVRARLHRIAQDHKAWDRLANLYEGMAEEAETAIAAADLLMEVARIRGEQKRPREAEAQLRRILGMLPNEPVARPWVERTRSPKDCA
jgi:hypothetical protein